MKNTFTILLFLLPFFVFSQVQFVSQDATKVYPDNTQITYMQLSDFPVDVGFLQFVENEVLSNPLIQRFKLSKDGETCFFHSHKDITENMIVEAINDAYYLYFTTEAYKPQNEENDKYISENDSDNSNVRQPINKSVSKENYEKSSLKQTFNKSISKEEYDKLNADKTYNKSILKEENSKSVTHQNFDSFTLQANEKPISALNLKKWEDDGIFGGFTPQQEIVSKRTQNTKHFQKDNGDIVAQIGGNYHYQNVSQQWQDIDFTITKTNDNGYAYSNNTNTIKTYFPETAGDKGISIIDKSMNITIWKNPELLILDNDKNIIQRESSLNNIVQVNDNIARYQSFNGVVDEIKIIDNGIENNIIINSLLEQWTNLSNAKTVSFKQFIELPEGVKIINSKGDFITNDFTDEFIGLQFADDQILYLNPLIVFDAQSNKEDAQLFYGLENENKIPADIKAKAKSFYKGSYTVKFVNNGIEIYSDVSLDWLQHAQYPVTVDPTWTIGSTASGSYYCPLTHWWGYQRHASLYLQSEINGYGNITQIEYYKTGTETARTKPTKVYMRSISGTTITSTAAWNSATYTSGATACYNGSTTQAATSGWKAIPLSTSYNYTSGNLLVMVYDAYAGSGSNQNMACASATGLQTKRRADGTDPGDATAMETDTYRGTIRLTYGTMSDPCASITPMTCGTTYSGTLAATGSDWGTYTGCSYNEAGDEVVYSFTPTTTGVHTFSTTTTTGDPDFFLMSSCGNTGTNIIGSCWGSGNQS
ncbi:MAG: hypothetical protein PHE33_11275, partial [Bacteroidales bacterium]|nr:hypothetical protein [Bacteroidales bacterium]